MILDLARSALLAAALILGGAPIVAAQEKPKVVTTFTVIADMARNVAGDAAIVESITKPGAEIHNYQPTPRDILKAQDASLVLWNGLNLEVWFEKFLANLNDVPSAIVSDGIQPMGINEGPYTGKPNPHAWMSGKRADLRREHQEGARLGRSGQHRRLRGQREGLRRKDQGAFSRDQGRARQASRGQALARHQRGRVQLPHP